jgi:hypothetical protein
VRLRIIFVERVLPTGGEELVDAQTELAKRLDTIHQAHVGPARGIGIAACRRRQKGKEVGEDVG